MQKLDVRARRITLLFMLTYFISYVTRVNYGAVISEMVSATGLDKTVLSIALTGSFVTYGVGQIVSGFVGDRFSPKKTVAAGIALSTLMNFALPFCRSPVLMTVVWCVNGFAQALLWPPIVRLMTENFDPETYKRSSVLVTYGSSLGTVAVYLVSPLLILISGYRLVFFVSALCGALMLPAWLRFAPDGKKRETPDGRSGDSDAGILRGRRLFFVFFTPVMLLLMFAIACQGMLRDGVTTWMPSLVSENFDVGRSSAILSGVIMPIFGMVSLKITSYIYQKKLKNPLFCAGTIFSFGALSALALCFSNGRTVVGTVLFTALLIAAMHGVNLIMTCMIPPFFKNTGRVSTVSGVLNACTYVGSAISIYGVAYLSESFSWLVTLTVWCAVAAAGALICFFIAPRWKKRFPNEADKTNETNETGEADKANDSNET